tara:strand:- start:101 stop:1243 length:1143 start_codon:yes stop_codon:yes gene_type:complete
MFNLGNNKSEVIKKNIKKNIMKKKVSEYFNNSSFIHTFIFIDSFPELKNAESELLLRINIYCNDYNIDFIKIDKTGIVLSGHPLTGTNINIFPVNNKITVIGLHHDSKKISNHTSILTLWNPVPFMVPCFRNIIGFDGYLSAYSPIIDQFIYSVTSDNRMYGHLTTSLPLSIVSPINKINKNPQLFYVGTNWQNTDRDTNFQKDTRGSVINLLNKLDNMNIVNIFGPTKFGNIIPWKGFKSYKGEIQFDGISVIKKIQETGICLVLSTQQHIRNEICSMRIFEGIAAGVPIICDKNPFFETWFGDNVFYLEGNTPEEQSLSIQQHIEYIESNHDIVYEKIKNCRETFYQHFSFDMQFATIINNIRGEDIIKVKSYLDIAE